MEPKTNKILLVSLLLFITLFNSAQAICVPRNRSLWEGYLYSSSPPLEESPSPSSSGSAPVPSSPPKSQSPPSSPPPSSSGSATIPSSPPKSSPPSPSTSSAPVPSGPSKSEWSSPPPSTPSSPVPSSPPKSELSSPPPSTSSPPVPSSPPKSEWSSPPPSTSTPPVPSSPPKSEWSSPPPSTPSESAPDQDSPSTKDEVGGSLYTSSGSQPTISLGVGIGGEKATKDPLITSLCDKTEDAALCLSSVAQFYDGKSDLNSVVATLIKSSTAQTRKAMDVAGKMATDPKFSSNQKMVSNFNECKEHYDNALDNLQEAVDAMADKDIGTLLTMMSATISDFGSCDDSFTGQPNPVPQGKSPMAPINEHLMDISGIILTLANEIH